MFASVIVAVSVLASGTVRANREVELRLAFEGTRVAVKMDMPATERGIDVRPERTPRVDLTEYAKRLKEHGTSLRTGQSALITKIKVKEKLIEVQLDGGGYGTFGDEDNSISVQSTEKSTREKELEKAVKAEKDPVRKRELQRELDDVARERRTEDRRLQAVSAAAEEARKARIRDKALASGSRFNVRFEKGVTEDALTKDGIRAALADFVDFDPAPPATPNTPTAVDTAVDELRKGLSFDDVERMWGEALKTQYRTEAGFAISSRTYVRNKEKLEADFVEGVLVRYRVSSN